MALSGFCLPSGGCVAINTEPIQLIVAWFLILAQNIEFIGVALGASLLLYVEVEIKSMSLPKGPKKKGTEGAIDCFLFSLGLFLLSAIIDWATSVQLMPALYENLFLLYVEAIVFLSALIALIVGIAILRQVSRTGKGRLLPPLFYVVLLGESVWLIFNAGIVIASIPDWSQLDLIGRTFTILLTITIPIAFILMLTSTGKKKQTEHAYRMLVAMFIPVIPWMFLLIVLFAEPSHHGLV